MIRRATIEDLDDICRIFADRWDGHTGTDYDYSRDDLTWYLTNKSPGLILVNQPVTGFLFGYDMGLWGYIEHMVVDKDHRGKGTGRELIETFVNWSWHWRIVETCYYSEVQNLKGFLDSVGFEEAFDSKWVLRRLR